MKGACLLDVRGVSCVYFEDRVGVETGFGGVDAAGHINGDIRVAYIERKLLMELGSSGTVSTSLGPSSYQ